MGKFAKHAHAELDLEIPDDGLPWSYELHVPALGDLTGAIIVAPFKPNGAALTTLEITSTAASLLASRFTIGRNDTLYGNYNIRIQLPGSINRTYIAGVIRLKAVI